MKILFVCTGNTCRSAMAEGIAKKMAAEKGLNLEISSAGTLGISGEPASVNAQRTCGEIGIDLSRHLSSALTADMIRESDIVLGMEYAHLNYCKRLCEDAENKLFLIGGIDSGRPAEEIPDPIGMDIRFFRDVRDKLKDYIEKAIENNIIGN